MKDRKEISFEGFLYQDVSTNRKPIHLMDDAQGFHVASIEKRLSNAGIVPTIATERVASYGVTSDFVGKAGGSSFVVSKESVRDNIKKVKVTVIIEEL